MEIDKELQTKGKLEKKSREKSRDTRIERTAVFAVEAGKRSVNTKSSEAQEMMNQSMQSSVIVWVSSKV